MRLASIQPAGATEPVYTDYRPQPVPSATMDWCAWYDSYEPGDPLGWGASEAAAVADLIEQSESKS